jgi:hypothetical protein
LPQVHAALPSKKEIEGVSHSAAHAKVQIFQSTETIWLINSIQSCYSLPSLSARTSPKLSASATGSSPTRLLPKGLTAPQVLVMPAK